MKLRLLGIQVLLVALVGTSWKAPTQSRTRIVGLKEFRAGILGSLQRAPASNRNELEERVLSVLLTYWKGSELSDLTKLSQSIVTHSLKNSIDPFFTLAIIKTESSFRPNTVGTVGEIGLMQIRPETAMWISKKKGIKWRGRSALFNPAYNVEIGTAYFSYLISRFSKDTKQFIQAYNLGPTKLIRMSKNGTAPVIYFNKVIKHYRLLEAHHLKTRVVASNQ
ncbi:MAG: lytic transglycosylase domain-containing protein [Bdellovibrionales bacterium]|nr:lytic transglycosylase domain-containing protein [Bdellovibrionales bacterium]